MVETLSPTSLIGVRDRALLLVGFAGAFRRSELVSLDVADIAFNADGLVVQVRRSKTDQEGEGRKVGLPFGSNPLTCPVRSLRAWLDMAGIVSGPIFRPVDRHGNLGTQRLTDQVGGAGGETVREGGWVGLGKICGALAAVGAGYCRDHGGCV
jgi:integrase